MGTESLRGRRGHDVDANTDNRCPVTAGDVVATIYHALGIPPDLEVQDRLDRPMLLVPEGAPIRDLFS